jgi:hypothetical protein
LNPTLFIISRKTGKALGDRHKRGKCRQRLRFQPEAVFIDTGRGEGVIDRLRQLGFSIIEVNFGGKPMSDSYANTRSEMWDAMAKWLPAGAVISNHAKLKTDLAAPTYKFDAANKLLLESKDEIKKGGLRSTDIADARAITFASARILGIDPTMTPSRTCTRGCFNDAVAATC